jgi:hypothetical protein
MSLEVSMDMSEITVLGQNFVQNVSLKSQVVLKIKRADGHIFGARVTAYTMVKNFTSRNRWAEMKKWVGGGGGHMVWFQKQPL